jgi:hypothetical protein
LLAALLILAAGCSRRGRALHYLPGFVPGSQNVFKSVVIEVTPTASRMPDVIEAGAVYDPDGKPIEQISVRDLTDTVNDAIVRALSDAGLKPVAIDAGAALPAEATFVLGSTIESASVEKRFSAEQTIHGQYFDMNASVKIKYELRDRAGKVVYSREIEGREHEPPKPIGLEVFLPLETDPYESLSVAMSRAVGELIVDPAFSALMPPLRAGAAPQAQ